MRSPGADHGRTLFGIWIRAISVSWSSDVPGKLQVFFIPSQQLESC